MSVATTNRVWRQSRKGGAPLLLLLAMADWSDDWGYCHPSLDQMAIKCRQTDRNILNLICELEKAGELRRMARGKGGRGKSSGSVYQVMTGMSPNEIAASERVSPLARSTIAKLECGEMSRPAPRKPSAKTGEKISGEKFSPEKQSPEFSPLYPCALNELINVSDNTPSPTAKQANVEPTLEEQAEALYRLVRPTHLTLPNSDQRAVALKVLGIYLKRCDTPQAAAETLKPFALEADTRGISPTNLCWLSEWAAVGQIPKPRKKTRTNAKQAEEQPAPVDYEKMRKQMESKLAPFMDDEKRNPS